MKGGRKNKTSRTTHFSKLRMARIEHAAHVGVYGEKKCLAHLDIGRTDGRTDGMVEGGVKGRKTEWRKGRAEGRKDENRQDPLYLEHTTHPSRPSMLGTLHGRYSKLDSVTAFENPGCDFKMHSIFFTVIQQFSDTAFD